LIQVRDQALKFVPAISDVVNVLTGAEGISTAVYYALILLAGVLAVMFAKFILIAAGIGIAILAIEDIIVYFRGGESAIGLLIEKIGELYDAFKEKFPNIAKFVEQIWEILVKVGKWTGGQLIQTFDYLYKVIGLILTGLEKVLGYALQLTDWSLGFTLGDIVDGISGLDNWVREGGRKVEGWFQPEPQTYKVPSYGPTLSQGGKVDVSVVQHISGSNAMAVADESKRGLDTYLSNVFPGGTAPATQ